jgi:5'-methylthioadenosine phosphorylase
MIEKAIGIIGGSGLYEIGDLKEVKEKSIETPFGPTSDNIIEGNLHGKKVYFLPRHGKGHFILPSEINFKANIWAMKKLNVTHILSVSAVGSMKEEIAPGDIVIPDQFIDRTTKRTSTFFGNGIVAHVAFADPICGELANLVYNSAKKNNARVHKNGTYLCIEGPQFSSRAESLLYRSWKIDVIGMTNATEAKLAREASICYTTIALATDYDCWHENEESVTVEGVLEVMKKNVEMAKKIIVNTCLTLDPKRHCKCHDAMLNAIVTDRNKIPEKTKKALEIIIG